MNQWEKPSFCDVDMSAEIGGYQGDDPERQNGPDDAAPHAASESLTVIERS
jgi:hypothetical protein